MLGSFSFMASPATFRIVYDGPDLAEHQIDVQDLAPALMGLADIFSEANEVLNGEKCTIRVLVTPDIEKQCFDIALRVIQENYTAIKALFTHENIVTAGEIVDWIIRPAELGGI